MTPKKNNFYKQHKYSILHGTLPVFGHLLKLKKLNYYY